MSRRQAAGAAGYVPERPTLPKLRKDVQTCRGCDLYAHATQAVMGEGPTSAQIVFIGEQPGDEEDRQGHPFVGPAGKVLDRALADAGIDRSLVYITNAVKHFKFEERGKRRLHKKPSRLLGRNGCPVGIRRRVPGDEGARTLCSKLLGAACNVNGSSFRGTSCAG
jgi:uracil-DNA glycosylase family protein